MTNQPAASKYIYIFLYATTFLLTAAAFSYQSPVEILQGLQQIILSRDALITDYFLIGGIGTAFFNSAILLLLGTLLIAYLKLPCTGLSLAALFMFAGYGFFGKNIVNILPILLGSYLYSRMQGVKFSHFAYVALFATSLSPFVTEFVYLLPFNMFLNILAAILIGIMIGYVFPPLAAHTLSMHMGYSLFNAGFSAGLLGFVIVCVLRSFRLISTNTLIWSEGCPPKLLFMFYGYFLLTFLYGCYLSRFKLKLLLRIWRHPGRAVTDFVLLDSVGPTFMNMGMVGTVCLSYILLVGGDLSGPVLGAALSIFGFAAFGVHVKNYLPVLLGVYLSTCLNIYSPTTPAVQLAAIFCAGLAPISGQFGVLAGVISGILHTAIVMYTGDMLSGLNLYNNGFAGGFVAIIMVPLMESFIKRFKLHRHS